MDEMSFGFLDEEEEDFCDTNDETIQDSNTSDGSKDGWETCQYIVPVIATFSIMGSKQATREANRKVTWPSV